MEAAECSSQPLPTALQPTQNISDRQTLVHCGFCWSRDGVLIPCEHCGTVAYCTQEHQRFDWKRHKPLCKTVLSHRSPPSPPKSPALRSLRPPSPIPAPINLVRLQTVLTSTPPRDVEKPSVPSSMAPLPSQLPISHHRSLDDTAAVPSCSSATSSATSVIVSPQPSSNPLLPLAQPIAHLLTQHTSIVPSSSAQPQAVVVPCFSSAGTGPFRKYIRPDATVCGPSSADQSPMSARRRAELTFKKASSPARDVRAKKSPMKNSPKVSKRKPKIIETDDPDIQIIEGASSAETWRPHRKKIPASQLDDSRRIRDHTINEAYSVTPEEHRRYLMEQGRSMNVHQAGELRLCFISEHILKCLNEYGWAVVDNFLGMDHCKQVNKEMQTLESRGLFGDGQLVETTTKKDEQHVKDIRSDRTYWFTGADSRSADACTIRLLVTYIDGIVNKFARRLKDHKIQGRSKAMLAVYPGNGSRYVKHVDNPAKDGRRITVIYYCNPGWDLLNDGGVLRLYPESSRVPLDIEPKADRLLIFWSDQRIPHEVMPVYRDRYAITVWYMDRDERVEHIKRSDPSKHAEMEQDKQTRERIEKQALESIENMMEAESTASVSSDALETPMDQSNGEPIPELPLKRPLQANDDQADECSTVTDSGVGTSGDGSLAAFREPTEEDKSDEDDLSGTPDQPRQAETSPEWYI